MKNILIVMIRYGVKTFLGAIQRYYIWLQRGNTVDSAKSWLSFKRAFRNSGLDFEDYETVWSSKYDCYVLDFPGYGIIEPLTDEFISKNPEILPLVR